MEDTDIEWDAFLQQLPDSPAICLDDFLFPLMEERQISPPDPNGKEISCLEQGSLTLSVLSDILLNDEEGFQVPGAGDGAGEFLDMKSFLDEFCTGDACNDVDGGEGFQVDACNDVDEGSHVHADADNDVSKGEVVDVEGRKKRPAGGEEEKAVDDFSRKRKRESAVKSRERKKVYVEFLEANCGMMEKRSWGLEESFSYSATENVVLKHELSRMKEEATVARHGGGGAELAALLADSLQKESLLCLLMTWVMLMALVVARLPPSAAPLKAAAIVVVSEKICKYGSRSCLCGGGRKWKWSRKKPKECY